MPLMFLTIAILAFPMSTTQTIAQVAIVKVSNTGNEMKQTTSKAATLSAEARSQAAAKILIDGKTQVFAGRLAAAAEAARILSPYSTHFAALHEAVDTGVGLVPAMDRAISDLMFRPRKEAKSPAGFPNYTPVGMIETKSYPAYRQVQTKMGGMFDDQRAFFRLFNHIKENEIAMTSPVPVERGADGSKTMSFLYGDAEIGELQLAGKVKVIDVPSITVVSIGMRYRESGKARRAAVAMLQHWLTENSETWVAAGGWRTMGWNSPMVRGSMRYWEVQMPIQLRGTNHL